jgi:hypothetical protein
MIRTAKGNLRMRGTSLVFLSLGVMACGAQYELRPSFTAGRTYVEATEVAVETTGEGIGTRSEQLRWVVERTVLSGGRLGQAPLAWLERTSRVTAGERGRRLLRWDSDSGLPPPEDYAVYAALSSLRAEIHVSPRGEVSVAGLHFKTDAMERSGWSDSLIAAVKRSVGTERLAQATRDFLKRLPARPVRLHDTWVTDWALLGLGAKWTWQLVAVSADRARFRVTGAVPSNAGSPLEIKRATGEAEVELASGLIHSLSLALTIRQPMGGVVLHHQGSLRMTTRVR